MARTQEQRKAETKARLLAAAADLFAREGFHATSTDAVADAADRTSGAVYAHFGGKEGLLLALLDAWENRTAAEMGERLEGTTTLTERLETMWTTFVGTDRRAGAGADADADASEGAAAGAAAHADDGLLLEHELWLYAARNPVAGDVLASRYATGRRGIAEGFERWAAEHDEDLPVPPDQLAVVVMALLLGLEMQQRVDPDAVPDRLAVEGIQLLFD